MTAASPILFLVFNRPDTTTRVFEAIRVARPSRLYVAADGPRPGRAGEAERCAEARRIATAVDWPCELKVLFRNENLGCRRAVFGAISWFFENEAEGIILEDDLLPDPTFFEYCDELLERYRDDPRIMAICGGGYGDAARFGKASYTFARSFDPWGWASWRRAWQRHDGGLTGLGAAERLLKRIGPRGFDCGVYWQRQFSNAETGVVNSWAYPWTFSIFKAGGLVAYPASNLISNIGHRDDATHTRPRQGGVRSPLADMPTAPLHCPLSHPQHVRNNPGFEVNLYTRRLELVRMSSLGVVRLAAHRKYAAARARVSHHVPAPLKARLRSWRAKRVANVNN